MTLRVEVACATPAGQRLASLTVPDGTSARAAVLLVDWQAGFPGLDFARAPLGIFGKRLADPEHHRLKDGDRVEVYRPLTRDPKDRRRLRAGVRQP